MKVVAEEGGATCAVTVDESDLQGFDIHKTQGLIGGLEHPIPNSLTIHQCNITTTSQDRLLQAKF